MIQAASRLDLTLRCLLTQLSAVLNAAADHPGGSGMTSNEMSYGGPPTGTTLHIKRSSHCRIIAIGAGGSLGIPSVLTSFCRLFIFFFSDARDLDARVPAFFLYLSASLIFFIVFHRLLALVSSFVLYLSAFLSPLRSPKSFVRFLLENYKLSY